MPRDPRNPKRNHPTAKPIMRESSKALKPWRKFVTRTARAETPPRWSPIDVDVNLSAEFVFDRPALHFGTGRNAGVVKDRFVSTRPTSGSQGDLSKLVRAVEDSLTDAGVWTDDRLVVSYDGTRKRYARDGESPGVLVRISAAEPATS